MGTCIRKLLVLLLLPASLWATTTVTGTLQNLGTGTVGQGAFVRFWLRGCGGNIPRVNGTAVIAPSQGGIYFFDFAANSSGVISGTLYSTRDSTGLLGGDIECGGSKLAVWYGMQVFSAGKGGSEIPVHAKSGSTLDVTQVTPITTNPVITSPTGDSTYLRKDAGNSPLTGNLSSTGTISDTGGAHSGTETFTGALNATGSGFNGNCTIINAVRCISPTNPQGWAGSDFGAWLNAAQTNCAGACVVQVASGTYTLSTATTINSNVAVQLGAATITSSAVITMSANSALSGPLATMAVNTTPLAIIKMANVANLASLVSVSGNYVSIFGIALDGNQANNASAGPNLLINPGSIRFDVSYLVTGNSHSHGIRLSSTGNTNSSGSAKFFKVMSYQNIGDGISCQSSADVYVSNSEFENNQGNGIHLSDCPTWRIEHNDFGQNGITAGDGLKVDCTFAGIQSNKQIIVGNQFGNQYQNDLTITGYSGGTCSEASNIVGNSFLGSSVRSPANTFSEINLIDGGNNTISGNVFSASVPAHSEQYAISATETSSGRALPNKLSGNVLDTSTQSFGTAPFLPGAANGAFGLQIPLGSEVNGMLDLFNVKAGTTNPHKFIRVDNSGNWQLVNNGNTAAMLSIPDAAVLTAPSATDTLVGRATTDTLTNKTLNVPLANGTGYSIFNTATTCTTAASIGASCTTAAINLPAAEADTSYRISCQGKGAPTNVPVVIATTNSSATQFTITIAALTAAAASFASYDCTVGHN